MKIPTKWGAICLQYCLPLCRCVHLWWLWHTNNFRRHLEVFASDKHMVKVTMLSPSSSVLPLGWHYFGKAMNLLYFKVLCIALTVLFSKWGVRVLHRKKILPHFFRDSVSWYITGAWLPISHVMKVVWVYPRLVLSKAPYS